VQDVAERLEPKKRNRTAEIRELLLLAVNDIPTDVENLRKKVGLKNWESTKALTIELFAEGKIAGAKTTRGWLFWRLPSASEP
jgi:hypothetical protein